MTEFQVLHIIDHMGLGGAQRLIAGVVKNNSNHYLISLRQKGGFLYKLPAERWMKPKHKSRMFFLKQVVLIPSIINKNNIDIIHSHLNGSWGAAILLWLMLRKTDILFVFHEHDPNEVPRGIYLLLLRVVLSIGNMIAISKEVKRRMLELGFPDERVHLLTNYIDSNLFYQREKKQIILHNPPNVQRNAFVVGFAGRLVARKGWRKFLEVAEQTRDEEIQFLIAGSGQDESKIVRFIKSRHLKRKVIFLGPLENIANYYHGLDVLFVPSIEEPMGLVQLEAQACGIPVIAFDIPGMGETLSPENAILVHPHDNDRVAQEIQRLKQDQDYYNLFVKGGLVNARKFLLDDYMNDLNGVYTEIAKYRITRKDS